MANPVADLLSDSLSAPLGDVIASVGRGVAEAQAALDQAALAATLEIYETQGDEGIDLLRSIGYRPTFYVLPETTCEVQVSMVIGGAGAADGSAGANTIGRARTYVTPVDAAFQQRYNFQASGAAKLTFKIVPVPPPSALDDAAPMPDVIGLKASDALVLLEARGVTIRFVSAKGEAVAADQAADQTIVSQDVAPRTFVAATTVVALGLK